MPPGTHTTGFVGPRFANLICKEAGLEVSPPVAHCCDRPVIDVDRATCELQRICLRELPDLWRGELDARDLGFYVEAQPILEEGQRIPPDELCAHVDTRPSEAIFVDKLAVGIEPGKIHVGKHERILSRAH